MKGRRGSLLLFAAAALCLLLEAGSGAAAERDSSKAVHLAVGYSAQIFIDVDVEEARGVAKAWADQILKRRFSAVASENFILDDVADLEKAFAEKKVDLAVLISDEYLRLRGRVPLEPAFVSANDRGPYHQIVLLVRRDSGFRRLSDLHGKRLTLSRDQSRTIHLTWLETLLMKEGARRAEDFFSAVKEVKKPSQAILPVYFNQADACLTTLQSFDVVRELNPQVGEDLAVLAQSADVAGGVLVFRPDYDSKPKEKMLEVLGTLQADPQGGQLLKLFRMSRLIPFRPEYVETVEALLREHERLRQSLGRRK